MVYTSTSLCGFAQIFINLYITLDLKTCQGRIPIKILTYYKAASCNFVTGESIHFKINGSK